MKKLLMVFLLMGLAFWAGMNVGGFALSGHPADGAKVNATDEKAAITQTLSRQSGAWNTGDIDDFMTDYWKSDDLRFASGGTVKYGWQTTSDRYKTRYPDKATMGKLAFTDLDIEILLADHALVFGRWTLIREADISNGLFTLHMRKENGRWAIVSDHTSSAD